MSTQNNIFICRVCGNKADIEGTASLISLMNCKKCKYLRVAYRSDLKVDPNDLDTAYYRMLEKPIE